MHYEEKVIDGVLCWRPREHAKYIPYTAEQLTRKLLKERNPTVPAGDDWKLSIQ